MLVKPRLGPPRSSPCYRWRGTGGCRHGCDQPGHHGWRRARAGQLRGKEPGVCLDLLAAAMPDGCAALHRAMDRSAPAIHRGEVALRISAQPRKNLTRKASRPGRLLVAILQILVGDREHRVGLDLDVAHETLPGVAIADPGVVTSRLHAGDAQPLVVIDLLVAVV